MKKIVIAGHIKGTNVTMHVYEDIFPCRAIQIMREDGYARQLGDAAFCWTPTEERSRH